MGLNRATTMAATGATASSSSATRTAPRQAPCTSAVQHCARDFPLLAQTVRGKPLVYLDNGATTQKPQMVIDAERCYYEQSNANIHRGVHSLSQQATDLYEAARARVHAFVHASPEHDVVFTRGTTEAINLVADAWGHAHLKPGDEVLITTMEHHANIVPWQVLCQRTGAILRVAPVTDAGELDLAAWKGMLGANTRMAAFAHVSNALGTINPVAEMTRLAHAAGALTLIDGAQAVAHQAVDLQALDSDFYVFSAHKLYGPTGLGVLVARHDVLQAMPPWQTGGDMIRTVSFERTTYADAPQRFEAGTPHIAGVVGLSAAMDYVEMLGLNDIAAHEHDLLQYATDHLSQVPGLRLIGTSTHKAAIVSFLIDGIHPHDLGTLLDLEGVAVRTGHHCAMPLMTHFKLPGGTVRASFGVYNTRADVDALLAAIRNALPLFDHEPKRKPRPQGQAQARQCPPGAEGSPDGWRRSPDCKVGVLHK